MYEDVYTEDWLDFTWDKKKEQINLAKHGFNFTTAVTVFADPYLIMEQDREPDGEARWQTIGMAEEHKFYWSPTPLMKKRDWWR